MSIALYISQKIYKGTTRLVLCVYWNWIQYITYDSKNLWIYIYISTYVY